MSSQYGEELPFEVKFNNFRDEVLGYGIPVDSPINFQKLLDILDAKIVDKQFGRDIVVSIHNYIDKAMHHSFTLSQFFDACLNFRRGCVQKVETAQIQLAKLQSERAGAADAVIQARQEEQNNFYGDKHNKILNLEVNGLQDLDIPISIPMFVKLSCYNIRFITAPKPYADQISWKDKFPFEIQTGFERVDVTVMMKPEIPYASEEVIGVAQVYVSSIKDQNYSNEWINLFNGRSLAPVGRVKLGLQLVASKAEYLAKIVQQIDEHITLQIEEIEDYEKSLKGLNTLLLPPRNSICQSPSTKIKGGFTSPHRRTASERASNCNNGSNEQCFRTILEEEDGESSANSSLDILQLPNMNLNSHSKANAHFNLNHNPRDFLSLLNATPNRSVEKYTPPQTQSQPQFQPQFLPQPHSHRVAVYTQEKEIRARSPFASKTRAEPYGLPAPKDSIGANSSLDTQSHSQSVNSELSKNILAASEGSDKDTIINYLQKKLNEATKENDHLNNFIKGLTAENQKLKMENAKIEGLETQIQDYEDKICMLLEEVQRLDQLANQRPNDNDVDIQDCRILKNSLNYAKQEAQYVQLGHIVGENIRLAQTLPAKVPEMMYSKQRSREIRDNPSPVQSPRLVAPMKSSMMSRGQTYGTQSQSEIDQTRRVREPVKIFPDERRGDVRAGFARPAY